ncbi:MAG: beta-lactamase family protein [Planctomycetes bacterium]|nr:beta-lactamase family protein [Planctomycetota bacterium]
MSFVLAALFATGSVQAPEFERFADALATEFTEREGVPGLQVVVRRGGIELLSLARGVADDARGMTVTDDTRFVVGSVARLFESAAVLQLVDAGELQLDADVVSLAAGLPKLAQPVRLVHVLGGTAGIAPWARVFAAAGREPRAGLARAEALALFSTAPFDAAPGEAYAPNGAAWALLPLVLEGAWGTSFARGAGPHLLTPLGLEHTALVDAEAPQTGLARDCEAVAHAHDADVLLALDPAWIAPTFTSTARDVARFVDALGAGRIVGEASTARFFTSAKLANGKETGHGIGFDLDRVAGHPRAFHSGGLGGSRARVAWYPDDGLAIVVLANCASADVDGLEHELARHLLGLAPTRTLDVPVSTAEVRRFGGTYQLATVRVRVFERSQRLVWQDAEGERELRWQGRGTFVDREHTDFVVRFDLEGDVAMSLERTRGSSTERGSRLP